MTYCISSISSPIRQDNAESDLRHFTDAHLDELPIFWLGDARQSKRLLILIDIVGLKWCLRPKKDAAKKMSLDTRFAWSRRVQLGT